MTEVHIAIALIVVIPIVLLISKKVGKKKETPKV